MKNIKYYAKKARQLYYLLSKKALFRKKEIHVGFIVQLPALWNKQKNVYDELRQHTNVKTYLFVVPENDIDNGDDPYKDNYFINYYPDAVKACVNGKVIDLDEYKIDYLFYPRPYDNYLPETLRSNYMMRKTKCCYIPYGCACSSAFYDLSIYNPFFNNMYFCFMDSQSQTELMIKEHSLAVKLKASHFEYLGYPAFEDYFEMSGNGKYVTWTPRWTYDPKQGGSHFLEYYKGFIELSESNPEESFLFRPHPLMFNELIKKEYLTEQEKEQFLEACKKNDIRIEMDIPIDLVLEDTKLLISDISSIIPEFFMTGRPIIYCINDQMEYTEEFAEMINYMYIAHSLEEVKQYYCQIINGNDIKKADRISYIDTKYKYSISASKRIAERLLTDSKVINAG